MENTEELEESDEEVIDDCDSDQSHYELYYVVVFIKDVFKQIWKTSPIFVWKIQKNVTNLWKFFTLYFL